MYLRYSSKPNSIAMSLIVLLFTRALLKSYKKKEILDPKLTKYNHRQLSFLMFRKMNEEVATAIRNRSEYI
jgi:hypothetical protein